MPPNHVGTDLTVPLAEKVRAAGVTVLEDHMAVELVRSEGAGERGPVPEGAAGSGQAAARADGEAAGPDGGEVGGGDIAGAVLMNTRSAELVFVRCRAVILATGGGSSLFAVNSNPSGQTGDGYALALRAGADLRDMEMIQFYPWRCIDPFSRAGIQIEPSAFVHGARLYNRLGERFMQHYDPVRCEATTRDVAARAIYDQIRKGLDVNGGVRMDLSQMDESVLAATHPKLWRALQRAGIDYRTYPFVIAPEAHYFMGGVVIDEHGQSRAKGLYAAGEVAGGIHGANRLDSNALPDTQVFGYRAGRHAAQTVRGAGGSSRGGVDRAGSEREAVERWRARLARAKPERRSALREEIRQLQQVMGRTLGIIRTAADLEEGLQCVRALKARLERVFPETTGEARDWVELGSMCDVAEASLTAALLRQESRGAHFRDDFPHTGDSRWTAPVVVEMVQGTLRARLASAREGTQAHRG